MSRTPNAENALAGHIRQTLQGAGFAAATWAERGLATPGFRVSLSCYQVTLSHVNPEHDLDEDRAQNARIFQLLQNVYGSATLEFLGRTWSFRVEYGIEAPFTVPDVNVQMDPSRI